MVIFDDAGMRKYAPPRGLHYSDRHIKLCEHGNTPSERKATCGCPRIIKESEERAA